MKEENQEGSELVLRNNIHDGNNLERSLSNQEQEQQELTQEEIQQNLKEDIQDLKQNQFSQYYHKQRLMGLLKLSTCIPIFYFTDYYYYSRNLTGESDDSWMYFIFIFFFRINVVVKIIQHFGFYMLTNALFNIANDTVDMNFQNDQNQQNAQQEKLSKNGMYILVIGIIKVLLYVVEFIINPICFFSLFVSLCYSYGFFLNLIFTIHSWYAFSIIFETIPENHIISSLTFISAFYYYYVYL